MAAITVTIIETLLPEQKQFINLGQNCLRVIRLLLEETVLRHLSRIRISSPIQEHGQSYRHYIIRAHSVGTVVITISITIVIVIAQWQKSLS